MPGNPPGQLRKKCSTRIRLEPDRLHLATRISNPRPNRPSVQGRLLQPAKPSQLRISFERQQHCEHQYFVRYFHDDAEWWPRTGWPGRRIQSVVSDRRSAIDAAFVEAGL